LTDISHVVVSPPLDSTDESETLRHEVEQLRRALSSRADIDQAKGALMLRYGITSEQAFGVLVRWSQHANVKLRVVALALLQAIGGEPRPQTAPESVVAWVAENLRDKPGPPKTGESQR
jgi:hypothetical protein